MCSEWFQLVEKANLSNEQTEQVTVAAQAQFKVRLYVWQELVLICLYIHHIAIVHLHSL